LVMPRILRWSFSLRLGHGSGGLVFDHDGGAYQSVRCPSWWWASGPPAESCLAVVAEIGSGDGSSECGAQPGALERERVFRCRLEGGATKSTGPLAEGAQDRCASGTAAATGDEVQVCESGTVGDEVLREGGGDTDCSFLSSAHGGGVGRL
jgi:hypothetical protein